MGKKKTKRFSSMKPNPIGLLQQGLHDTDVQIGLENVSSMSCDGNISSFISTVLEKLQSPNTEEKVCGCQMLTSIVHQPRASKILLQQNVSRVIFPLFLDSSYEIQISTLGAVRNLCMYGDDRVCCAVVDNDVLTPLTALIKQFDSSWKPKNGAVKSDPKSDILIHAVELLTYLCENNSKAVSIFNKENLLMLLLPMLNVDTYGYDLSCIAAQCLHVVSENNANMAASCQVPEIQSTLFQIACADVSEIDAIWFRTLVIGIVLNFSESAVSPYYKVIVKNLSDVLMIDHIPVLTATLEKQELSAKNETFIEESSSDVDKVLRCQGVSLELLANLCCTEDDEWEDMECEGMDELSSDDQATEGACAVDSSDITENLCLSGEIHNSFLENEVLSKIVQKTLPIDTTVAERLQYFDWGKAVQTKLLELQCRALLCLSNVISALDKESLCKTSLLTVWSDVYKLASTSQGVDNEDFKWAVTSAMRSVIQRLAELNFSEVEKVTPTDLELFVNIGSMCKNRESQINILRIISTIGCTLSTQIPCPALLTKIGMVLAEVACSNEDVVVVSEALDSLFDVFKEDNTDPVVREIGLIDKLKTLQPRFKTKVISQKKTLGENYGVVMMAKTNLSGYIKYKISQG